jgi:hypothetical protein
LALAVYGKSRVGIVNAQMAALVLTVSAMKPIVYARHRFPPDVIRHAAYLYLRFTLSYPDVEDLLAERGLTVSNESIRIEFPSSEMYPGHTEFFY